MRLINAVLVIPLLVANPSGQGDHATLPAGSDVTIRVRILVKQVSNTHGVARTDWLTGVGYTVKIGDSTNAGRYCAVLLRDPPGHVSCAVPLRAQVRVSVDKAGFSQPCTEPFAAGDERLISITARVDPDQRTLSCRLAGSS